uniref:DNA-directed RNA polymerase subunit Rpo1N n=1 Tax=Geoglobus ahangari TaxID=113653 RepID=A0A7C3UB79_9EURY
MIPKKIEGIKFEVLSPREIRRMSVVKIISPETYDDDGFPIEFGLMDPRLGVIDPGLKCRTCGGKAGECPGHFGHIELAAPVIHVGYAKLIARLLNGTCRECGRILLKDERRDKYIQEIEQRKKLGQDYDEILKEVFRVTKAAKKCPHCGAEQIEVKFEKPTFYYEGEHKLTPKDIREGLEKIPDEDLPAFGINPKAARPEWFVLTVLPVPPVTVRPSIILETGQRSEDDLTHKLVDIIRINQRFLENKEAGAPQLILEDLWELLQYHVTTYLDNEVSGIPPARHRSGRPLKTLAQRLKGKEGRFRGSLSGKRVNFSARTVISPDPCLSINEVGVPQEIAEELTVPIYVTPNNIDEAREFILRSEHPKANYVIRPDGRRIRVIESNKEELAEKLEPGWIVERQLMDGDIVLFNRQPSLHRMSIMAHYVKVLPYKTFRLNPAVCVAGDTKVLLDGVQTKIKDIEKSWKDVRITTADGTERLLTNLTHYWKLRANEYGKVCYRIVTESGREITATEDHPFYTPEGVKPAGKLKIGDYAIVYPMEFPEVEWRDEVVVTKEDIIRIAGNSKVNKVLKELKERKLIPLKLSDPRITAIARIVGHIFGDGSLILGRNSKAVFRAKLEDLEEISNDVRMLGYTGSVKVHKSSNTITRGNCDVLKISGKGYSFEVRKKSFCLLLKALGCPDGDKAKKAYSVPEWIKKAPLYVKKEFLASYFGSELTKPIVRSKCNKELVFKVSKVESILKDGMKFVEDLREILSEFGIKTTIRITDGNIRRDGSRMKVIVVSINSHKEFFGKIGYAYNRKAEELARLAYGYLIFKEVYLKERNNLLKNAKREEIVQALANGKSASALYTWRSGKSSYAKTSDFPSFEEWVRERSVGGGFIKERVVKIEPTEVDLVYDITTESHTHNFIANGFLTGNCPPYNADFDGDEMNLHVPQSLEAQAEAKILMAVQEHILSPRFGGPIIGGIHDHISGLYLLTRGEKLFSKEEVMELIKPLDIDKLPEPKEIRNGKPYWSGKQIFSMILPDITLEFKAEICQGCENCKGAECENDAYVIIKNGELIKGTIDEKAVGAFKGIIIDEIVRKYGNDEAKNFIDNMTKLAIRAIMLTGFSVGIDDEDIPEEAKKQIDEIIKEAEKKVEKLIETYKAGNLEPMPGRSVEETLEMKIMQELGRARDMAGKIAGKYLGMDNAAVIMAVSGARGSMLNLTQMAACIGQQSVRGERIKRGYSYTNRTLPHFKPGDLSAKARGFVKSSYKEGLSPIEFFFHAVGGREGLVDTAVRTSQSGYLQRRLINALQDIKVDYDGTVKEQTSGLIVQFRYGEDGVDPMKSFRGKGVDVKRVIKEVLGE